jgi:PilZ domain
MGDEQRREGRVPVAGTLRLLVRSGAGFLLASGEIVDLSPGGCAVLIGHSEMVADLKGRIEVSIGGQSISLPVVTRWVRVEGDGCIVGCRFFELNVTELRAIQELMIETCAITIESLPGRRSVG